MADPNLLPMYDTSSNAVDTNSNYYSTLQLQNQHHPQAMNRPTTYDSVPQRHERFVQQPMQKFDNVYQHDQYSGMQSQPKLGPYSHSGLQVQNLSQDQSFHSQGMHTVSNAALPQQQNYQVSQNYSVQGIQPQVQTQRQNSSWTAQNSQQQQGTIAFNRHNSSIEPQQHTLPHESSGHQPQSQRVQFSNNDHSQRMILSGNIMPSQQDPSQISQDTFQQYYQVHQSHNQHQTLYPQQQHFNQVYNQNKGAQMNYALKSEMQVDVGHDEPAPTLHSTTTNYRNTVQTNISNDQNAIMQPSSTQDRQYQQTMSAIPRYSSNYLGSKDNNIKHYTRNAPQQLQTQPYYSHPDSESNSQKIMPTDSYVTTELQEVQKHKKEGYMNSSQLQQPDAKIYTQPQYTYQSNGQSVHSATARQKSQMQQYLELQQQSSYTHNQNTPNARYLSNNTQSSTPSANYQSSVVLSHSGRVKGTRPLATVLTKKASSRNKSRFGDSSSDEEIVSHIASHVDSPTVTRRSLRQRKQKTYNEDFDYNITDEEEENRIKEANQSKTSSPNQEENVQEEEAMIVEKILSARKRNTEKGEEGYPGEIEEFYVKYKNYSYLHAEWASVAKLTYGDKRINMKVKRFLQKRALLGYLVEFEDDEPFNPEYVEVDRVLDIKTYQDPKTNESITHCLVKWKLLPYEDSTWEMQDNIQQEKIEQMKRLTNLPPINPRMAYYRPHPSEWIKLTNSPMYKSGNVLRDYQLEGLNWLLFCWFNRQNSILADEMGLGKTIQSLSFLNHLLNYNIRGPFLVIAPLSTIANWQREIEAWTDMNVVVYHGSSASRQLIRDYELYYRDSNGVPNLNAIKFQIIITTYEIILSDNPDLRAIPWKVVVIDEAHRLKNRHCKLLEGLKLLHMDHRILLTGTPLQNNVEELFSLLNFLEPARFASDVMFLSEFGNLKTEAQVDKLQTILKPMMLRRLKEDVEKNLAPKEETIIEVELTPIQKKFYRAILERNFNFLSKGANTSNLPNLMNTMMELRKCCNHPFLINGAEEKIVGEFTANNQVNGINAAIHAMIQASGKLVLIDKLLPKLKDGGHKVLIFSQMVRCLDILEDYLVYRRYQYERIDGRVRGNLRQAAIDRFCKPESDRFVFLLCTRAGGLGINLTAADTVVIFDSDWNPQNDLQAQARCHRIGQSKAVKVYRLITQNSYEREMFDRASLKLGLDRAVLQSMSGNKDSVPTQQGLSKRDVEDLLRKGAYGALMEEDNEDSSKFCEEDIDQILERRTQVIHIESEGKGSTFAKASFVSSDNQDDIDIDDPNFWQKWAQKANLDMDDSKSKEGLILNEPRQRRQTKRYGTDDTIYDISDEDLDPDYTPKKQVGWSRVECFRVEKYLLIYGWGRWKDILRVARFKRKLTEKDIEAISKTILLYCAQFYNGDDKVKDFVHAIVDSSATGTSKEIVAGPIGRGRRGRKGKNKNQESVELPTTNKWKSKNSPDVLLQDDGYKKHLRHHCNKILLRIRLMYYLRFDIANDIAEQVFSGAAASKIPLHIPAIEGDPPCKWWNKEADKSLLIGVLKHGYEKYDLIAADPALYFFDLVELTSVHEKLANKDTFDDMDYDSDNDDKRTMKPKRRKINEEIDASFAEGKYIWPSSTELNTRLRRAITAYQRNHKKQQLKKAAAEKERERKERFEEAVRQRKLKKIEMASRWSKREEVDFYRIVSTFGVEYESGTDVYNWEKFRQLARLDKKSNEKLTAYYIDFIRMCEAVCNKSTASDFTADFSVGRISKEKAARCLRRIRLLNSIRREVLQHPKLDERLMLAEKSCDLPSWWIYEQHDKELLVGVARHGVTRIEFNLCNDSSLSFGKLIPTLPNEIKASTAESPVQASAATNDENLTEVSMIPNPLFTVKTENDRGISKQTNSYDDNIVLIEKSRNEDNAISDNNTASNEIKYNDDSRNNADQAVEHNDVKEIATIMDKEDVKDTGSLKSKHRENDTSISKLNKWPKDKLIIRRLELLCKLIIDGIWPTGTSHPASPLEDNEDAIVDDDFSPDRFKVKRVSALKVTITNKKGKRGRKPKKNLLPKLTQESSTVEKKSRKSKGHKNILKRKEPIPEVNLSIKVPPAKKKRSSTKKKRKETKEKLKGVPKKRGRKPGKTSKASKSRNNREEESHKLSSTVKNFPTEQIVTEPQFCQSPSYVEKDNFTFGLHDEPYSCKDDNMFDSDISLKSHDKEVSADKAMSSHKTSNDGNESSMGNSPNHSFDNNQNVDSYQDDQLQEFAGDLYSTPSPSLPINDDILTSCNNSPRSTSEDFFGVNLLPGEPVLDTSDKIAYEAVED